MRILFLLVLLGLMWKGNAWGNDPVLPGSTLSVAKAVVDADSFFIGLVISVTPVSSSDSAFGGKYESKVKFTRGIRGPISILNAGNSVFFTLQGGETMPQVGQSYVFCVTGQAQQPFEYVAVKILVATDANIGEIRHLAHDKLRK
jgi:hypothetical protein